MRGRRGRGQEMTRLVLFFLFCFFYTLSRPRERFRARDVMAGKEL